MRKLKMSEILKIKDSTLGSTKYILTGKQHIMNIGIELEGFWYNGHEDLKQDSSVEGFNSGYNECEGYCRDNCECSSYCECESCQVCDQCEKSYDECDCHDCLKMIHKCFSICPLIVMIVEVKNKSKIDFHHWLVAAICLIHYL